jgi:hypothetical protein
MIWCLLLTTWLADPVIGLDLSQSRDPRREPGTALAESVRLLERKDYAVFLETFLPPDDLKEALAEYKTLDALADRFGKTAPDTLLALRAALKTKPVMNPAGTRADFRLEQPAGGRNRVLLSKIGEYWFIRD